MRHILHSIGRTALVVASIMGFAAAAAAQSTWPSAKQITLVHPFAAGSDYPARVVAAGIEPLLGQKINVEPRPGAGGAMGTGFVARQEPDGYTFCLLTASTISLNPFLYTNLSYDPPKDLEPITNVVFTQQVMIVHKSVPVNTLAELIAYSKANPQKLNFGSFGVGGDSHLVFEWLKAKSGAQMTHIPYGGAAPALVAVERGDAHLLFPVASPAVLERIKSGLVNGGWVEVTEGLKGDERIVVVGQGGLKTGTAVKVVASDEGAPTVAVKAR